MRKLLGGLFTFALVCAAPGLAAAQDEEEEISPTTKYSHAGQFGFHAQVGTGYRAIFTYDEADFCGQISEQDGGNKSACTGRSPAFLDLGLSYGLTRSFELFVEMRLGLETDFGETLMMEGPKNFVIHPGMKLYIDDAGQTKFFSSVALALDITSYEQAPETDIGIRNVNGLQFDLHKTVGIYFFFGETIAFKRWLRFELDAGLGLQARFP
jgi:hypothetical protein